MALSWLPSCKGAVFNCRERCPHRSERSQPYPVFNCRKTMIINRRARRPRLAERLKYIHIGYRKYRLPFSSYMKCLILSKRCCDRQVEGALPYNSMKRPVTGKLRKARFWYRGKSFFAKILQEYFSIGNIFLCFVSNLTKWLKKL